MRAIEFIIIALLVTPLVSAAPLITVTYDVEIDGTIEVLSIEAEDGVYEPPNPAGEFLITWSGFDADGTRTSLVEQGASFSGFVDDFETGNEYTLNRIRLETSIPVKQDTVFIFASTEEGVPLELDLIELSCSGSCPTCRTMLDVSCMNDAVAPQEPNSTRSERSIDPMWIAIGVLAAIVAGLYLFLLLKMRKR